MNDRSPKQCAPRLVASPSNPVYRETEVAKSPQIPVTLGRQSELLREMHGMIDDVESRLQSVMEIRDEKCPHPPESAAPLPHNVAAQLSDNNEVLERAIGRLAAIRDRLQL